MRKNWLVLVLLTIVGCQAPSYKPPTSGQQAELTVARAEGARSGRIWPFLFRGPECAGRQGMGRIDEGSDGELAATIIANRTTVVQIQEYDIDTRTSCDVMIEFNPVEGGRYRATWSRAGNRCFVRLERATTRDGKEVLTLSLIHI